MSTGTPDLPVPPAAVAAYFVCGCSESGIRSGYKPEAIAVIVAAELRVLADEMDRGCADYVRVGASPSKVSHAEQQIKDARALRFRANALSPDN